MKLTINYVLLFSLLVFLKFNDSKENDPLKLGSYLVIAYLIYQLFKNQNVEGWPSGTDPALPSFPTCGDGDLLYIGSPSPSPGPDDNIMRSIGNSDFLSEDPIIYVGKTCLEMPWTTSAASALHADWVSNRIDRDNIKTIAFVKKTNRLMDPTSNGLDRTNEGMIFCSSSPNDTCVPDAAVTDAAVPDAVTAAVPDAAETDDAVTAAVPDAAETDAAATDSLPSLYRHCMAGDDDLINTTDLLDCFSSGGSRCGHENCALYHSLHLDHIVTDDTVHSSPNDHCSHLLYYGGSPNPTMDHGSVIQQIVLKYANHYDQSINTPEEFETAVMSNEILLGAGNSNVFTDSEEDQELCAKFNALYDSDCLRGSSDNSHSQLFETIHTACSNISPPSPDFNLQDDWLNNMDRYCSIGSSSQTKYNGVPMTDFNSQYDGFLYVDSGGFINDNLRNISSPQTCSVGYQGDYMLVCNNSIDRLVNSLEVSNSCSPSPTSVAVASAPDIDGLLYQLENLKQEQRGDITTISNEIIALSQSITVVGENSASPGDLTRLRDSLEAEIAEIQGTGTIPANIQVELTNLRGELDNLSTAARPEDIRRIKGEIEMLHSEDSRDISNLGKRISKLNRELTSISAASPGDLSSLQTSLETDMGNIQSQINTLQSSPNISSEEFEALRQELTDSLTRLRQTESDMSNLQAINQAPVPPPAQEEESMFNKYWPFILFVVGCGVVLVVVLLAKSRSKTTADSINVAETLPVDSKPKATPTATPKATPTATAKPPAKPLAKPPAKSNP